MIVVMLVALPIKYRDPTSYVMVLRFTWLA